MTAFDWKTYWPLLAVLIAVLQWVIFLAVSWWSRRPHPKGGMRGSEWRLIFSTVILAVVWLVAFDVRALFGAKPELKATAASSTPSRPSQWTCASITVGMKADEVMAKLGQPDQEVSEEDTRGPGARGWIFRNTRCVVHLLDDTVEVVD